MTDRSYISLRHLVANKKETKASKFCKDFVHDIFDKFDGDRNNHLDRFQLTNIFSTHYKQDKKIYENLSHKNLQSMLNENDKDHDGTIDRYQLYQYCMNCYKQEVHKKRQAL